MIRLHLTLIFLTVSLLSLSADSAGAIQLSVSEVKDTRTTGQFFAGCEITVSLIGDDLAEVKNVRTELVTAIDDTGRDIKDPEKASSEFEEFGRGSFHQNSITMKLKNPARKASMIQSITGTVSLYVPSADPAASVLIPKALSVSGKKLAVPALAAAGIEFTLFTSADYAAFKKAEAESQAKSRGLDQAFVQAFGGGFSSGSGNELTFIIDDPKKMIVGYELVEGSGKRIDNSGSMTMNGVKSISYRSAVPADAGLKIFLATDKATIKVPLDLKAIALP